MKTFKKYTNFLFSRFEDLVSEFCQSYHRLPRPIFETCNTRRELTFGMFDSQFWIRPKTKNWGGMSNKFNKVLGRVTNNVYYSLELLHSHGGLFALYPQTKSRQPNFESLLNPIDLKLKVSWISWRQCNHWLIFYMADCEVAVVGNIDNLVLMSLSFLSFTTVIVSIRNSNKEPLIS